MSNDRDTYVTGRFLAAFDAAQAKFNATDKEMQSVITGCHHQRRLLNIRTVLVGTMYRPDEDGQRVNRVEILRMLGIDHGQVASDIQRFESDRPPFVPVVQKRAMRAAENRVARAQKRRERGQVIQAIVERVCASLDRRVDDIAGPSREIGLVTARRFIALLARTHTGASFPEIGRATGRTSHTSVLEQGVTMAAELRDRPNQIVCGLTLRAWHERLDREIAEMLGVQTGDEQRRVA